MGFIDHNEALGCDAVTEVFRNFKALVFLDEKYVKSNTVKSL